MLTHQLTLEYKDKRKRVDDMKEDLQNKIAEYSKLAESGMCSLQVTVVPLGSQSCISEMLFLCLIVTIFNYNKLQGHLKVIAGFL